MAIWRVQVVPGLLQAEVYARQIFSGFLDAVDRGSHSARSYRLGPRQVTLSVAMKTPGGSGELALKGARYEDGTTMGKVAQQSDHGYLPQALWRWV